MDNAKVIGNSLVGGLIGVATSTIISEVGVDAVVDGVNIVGGMVGQASGVNISDSYVSGAVNLDGDASFVGGLVGLYSGSDSHITNSYGTAIVKGGDGYDWYAYKTGTTTITNSYYWNGAVDKTRHSDGLRTMAELKTNGATTSTSTTATFSNWSTSTWTFPTEPVSYTHLTLPTKA